MKTFTKLLKITGTLCLSCICLTSKAEPKILTLEEVRAFLDKKHQEAGEKFLEIKKKIDEIAENRKPGDTAFEKEEEDLFSELCKVVSGEISAVEYDNEGKPTLIEIINGNASPIGDLFTSQSLRREYTQNYENGSVGLDKISKEIDPKQRGITDEELKLLGETSVREITFDSILSSDFFDEERRKKGRELLHSLLKLEEAIDEYVEKIDIVESVCFSFRASDLYQEVKVDEKTSKVTVDMYRTVVSGTCCDPVLICKISGERLKELKEKLKERLRSCILYKTGSEKIILMMLLDEITPPEYRLQWLQKAEVMDACYNFAENRIEANLDSIWSSPVVLHEIGHYLQSRLRLPQNFESYRNSFARKLLLLEHEGEKSDKTFSVPKWLLHLFEVFNSGNGDVSKNLNGNDLFMYWQLTSRWKNGGEIANILGVYFDQNRIYLDALSDIRAQKRIRYGHNLGLYDVEKKAQFEDPEGQKMFESIVKKAAERQPDNAVLKLLCKLHEVTLSEVVNFYDPDVDDDKADDVMRNYKYWDE